jgi:hypothetical protein
MFRFVKNFIAACRVVIRWSKAQDCASAGKYQEALFILYQTYALLGANRPTDKAPLDLNLLFAHVAGRLHHDDLVLEDVRITATEVNKSKKYSEAEKGYLRYYAALILEDRNIPQGNLGIAFAPPTFADIQFDKVPGYIKRNFPIDSPLASDEATLH